MGKEALTILRNELADICGSAAEAKGGTLNGVRETVHRLEQRIDELIEQSGVEWKPMPGTAQSLLKGSLERIIKADTSTAGVPGTYAEDALVAVALARLQVPAAHTEWTKHVHDAYLCLRERNSSIPCEVLNSMKHVMLSHEGPFMEPAPNNKAAGGTKAITAERLYRCVGCGAHYQMKVTSCDCGEYNAPFDYTRAYAVSHEAIEQLLAANRAGAKKGVERGLSNILDANEAP